MKRNILIGGFFASILFGAVSQSWALGVPGFPALNSAFGLISAFFVGIVEAYLVIQLIFHMAKLHSGQPGEKEKVVWLLFAIFAVPFVPSVAQFLYGLFFSTGATPSTNVWNGQ